MDERQRQERWQHVREGSKDLLVLRKGAGHKAARCSKGCWKNNLYAGDEQENGGNNEVHPDERETEQWQEAITRPSERKHGTL